jgi:hypothetical protein
MLLKKYHCVVPWRKLLNYPTLCLTASQKKGHALVKIEKLVGQAGKKVNEYPGIELPNSSEIKELRK